METAIVKSTRCVESIIWKPGKNRKEKEELFKNKIWINPQKQFHNGDRGKVLKIDEDRNIYLQKEDGKIFKLDGTKPLHLEYGYCSTVHAAQGKTCDRVLIEADTKSLTSAQDNYYVAISRARHEVKIYTNDKEKLPEAMNRKSEKESALEVKVPVIDKTPTQARQADREKRSGQEMELHI